MAFSFNGVGTMFYGQRDFRLDGTYVTTEWFVVFAGCVRQTVGKKRERDQ